MADFKDIVLMKCECLGCMFYLFNQKRIKLYFKAVEVVGGPPMLKGVNLLNIVDKTDWITAFVSIVALYVNVCKFVFVQYGTAFSCWPVCL